MGFVGCRGGRRGLSARAIHDSFESKRSDSGKQVSLLLDNRKSSNFVHVVSEGGRVVRRLLDNMHFWRLVKVPMVDGRLVSLLSVNISQPIDGDKCSADLRMLDLNDNMNNFDNEPRTAGISSNLFF